MFDYPVTLTQDGDSVLVAFADVPEAITFGADEAEALLNAIDALETACRSMSMPANRCRCQADRVAVKRPCGLRRWSAPNWASTKR